MYRGTSDPGSFPVLRYSTLQKGQTVEVIWSSCHWLTLQKVVILEMRAEGGSVKR